MSKVGKGDGEGATNNLPLPGTPLRSSCMGSLAVAPHSAHQAPVSTTQYPDDSSCACALCPVPPRPELLVLRKCDYCCTGDSGGAAMSAAFEEVVAPAAERFCPDIILVRGPFCHRAAHSEQHHHLT